jgi:hypothetical protein
MVIFGGNSIRLGSMRTSALGIPLFVTDQTVWFVARSDDVQLSQLPHRFTMS